MRQRSAFREPLARSARLHRSRSSSEIFTPTPPTHSTPLRGTCPWWEVRARTRFKKKIWEEPWEVVASFHYLPGGVKVDGRCESTIENLYAVGQVQGGLFGADRLGSVSLTELFVFAKIAAESALERLADGIGTEDHPAQHQRGECRTGPSSGAEEHPLNEQGDE